jgi:acyl-CoA thioester hydrolase
MLTQHELELRVRYQETDAQARVHHANFFSYFELARVEMLRTSGYSYRDLEAEGVFLVVAEISCKYHRPANFDDLLRIEIRTVRAQGARIDQEYRVYRDSLLLAEGKSTVACIDSSGRIRRLPDHLVMPE